MGMEFLDPSDSCKSLLYPKLTYLFGHSSIYVIGAASRGLFHLSFFVFGLEVKTKITLKKSTYDSSVSRLFEGGRGRKAKRVKKNRRQNEMIK